MTIKTQNKIWDKIAEEWSEYREKPFDFVVEFLKNKHGRILDLGGGSGRNLIKQRDLQFYLVDFSSNMLELAKKNAKKKRLTVFLRKSEFREMRFREDFFDSVIFISALHCVEKEKDREETLKAIYKVLKQKGKLLISVWNKNSKRFGSSKKEVSMNWKGKGKRYYYFYERNELEDLLKKVGFKILNIEENNNLNFIVEKPKQIIL